MLDRPYVKINDVEFTEFNTYTPTQYDITKGGRNELTGLNRLRLIAKKWKLVLTSTYISDEAYSDLVDSITDTLDVDVVFRDKDTDTVSFNGYCVITKDRTIEADAMGCWSNFTIEIIEN